VAELGYWIGAAFLFAAMAVATKGLSAMKAGWFAGPEVAKNLGLWVLNQLLWRASWPLLAIALAAPLTSWDFQSYWLPMVLGFLALEIVDYWVHRLRHSRWLWRFHKTHHSDRAMTWTTVHRKHPADFFLTNLCEMGFLVLLGIPLGYAAIIGLFRGLYVSFVHADLAWTLGPLRYILISPLAHRYHHALDERLAGSNFGGVLSIWDRMFGTYLEPDHRPATGVESISEPNLAALFRVRRSSIAN
jgi:sterol desaturase/sphingolipid hydroxylase (fatty acid hydroxylase superfamily)